MSKNRLIKRQKYIIQYELSHLDKVIVAMLIFFGTVIFFLGMNRLISNIPILNDPVVLITIGLLILLFTGSFIKTRHK